MVQESSSSGPGVGTETRQEKADGGVGGDSVLRRRWRENGVPNMAYDETMEDEASDRSAVDPADTEYTFERIQLHLDVVKSLREQPWRMRKKLETLRISKHYVQEQSVKLNRIGHLKESRIRIYRRFKRQFKNFIVFFIPWENRIKRIQGYFGAGIGSFFLFLRSLMWINIILFAFVGVFVVAPQLLSPSTSKKIPEQEVDTAEHLTQALDAKGYLQYSFLFYGYYGNEDIQIGVVKYPLPLAYFLVFTGIYLFSIVTILRAMSHEQKSGMSSSESERYPFGWRVFTAWDFLITERVTAANKLASNTTAIREEMLEMVEKGKEMNRALLFFLRMCANLLVLGVLGASAYLIFLVVKRSNDRAREGRPATLLEQYEISLAITGMNSICPVFFKLASALEHYHPRVALYRELSRIMVMYLGNIYVLVLTLLDKINQTKQLATQESRTTTTNSTLGPSLAAGTSATNTTNVPDSSGPPSSECWETTVGQELFKLSVIDLAALVMSVLAGELLVALTIRFLNCCPGRALDLEKLLGYPEFKLAKNVLQLIYSQGLIWMGLVFSPGLIGLNILKLVVVMYIRSWAVMVTNVPPKRIFKASHQFYLLLLLAMLFLCLLAVMYATFQIEPSNSCGPFRRKAHMYTVLTEAVDGGPSLLNTVVDYVCGPSVVIPAFIALLIIIYYYSSKAAMFQSIGKELLMQLQHERTEDKNRAFDLINGNDRGVRTDDSIERRQQGGSVAGTSEESVPSMPTGAQSRPLDKSRGIRELSTGVRHEAGSGEGLGAQSVRDPGEAGEHSEPGMRRSLEVVVHTAGPSIPDRRHELTGPRSPDDFPFPDSEHIRRPGNGVLHHVGTRVHGNTDATASNVTIQSEHGNEPPKIPATKHKDNPGNETTAAWNIWGGSLGDLFDDTFSEEEATSTS